MDYNILLSHGIEPRECSHLDYINNDKEILIFARIKPRVVCPSRTTFYLSALRTLLFRPFWNSTMHKQRSQSDGQRIANGLERIFAFCGMPL